MKMYCYIIKSGDVERVMFGSYLNFFNMFVSFMLHSFNSNRDEVLRDLTFSYNDKSFTCGNYIKGTFKEIPFSTY